MSTYFVGGEGMGFAAAAFVLLQIEYAIGGLLGDAPGCPSVQGRQIARSRREAANAFAS